MNKKKLLEAGKSGALPATVCIIFALLIAYVLASSPPVITLISPPDAGVFNTTNNITFQCNATDDGSLKRLDLYTDINGMFSLTNASCFGELCADSSTALLMHFNNDSSVGENDAHVYDWSGNGNIALVYGGATFNAAGGKFFGAFEFDGTAGKYMTIEDSNSIDLAQGGSIVLWVKPMDIATTQYILAKALYDGVQCGKSSYAIMLSGGYVSLLLNEETESFDSTVPLQENAWSHIAVMWNLTYAAIYINGAIDTTGISTTNSENNYRLWIGKATGSDCVEYYFNGVIDELAFYNRVLTAEEVSEHYNRTLTNNATRNFTISNIPDGKYQWNCKAQDNESQASWAGSNRTLYVDIATPPAVNSIALIPNSSDDVDPDVRLNVTANVTDPSGANTVMLQYGKVSLGFFTNATMAYNSTTKLYTASFIPDTNGIWRYRIWANDSTGNVGITNETNISVEDDYTWTLSVINNTGNLSGDLGRKYALKTTVAKMGVLVINNTGDSQLSFDLSATPNIATYNRTIPFTLNAKTVEYVEVNATAPETVSEYPLQITVASAGATPAQRVANGTLISYIGGPYLSVSIESYPQTAQQSTTINLSAKIKNIGNDTAENVWLNWSLPEGWTNTSGNLSQYIGNLASDATGWNNIQAYISPTLANSNFSTIYASASSSNNATSLPDSKLTGVSCSNTDGACGKGCSYVTDSDCSAPSGDTGSSGGSGRAVIGDVTPEYAKKYALAIEAPKRIDAYRGQTARFSINISNAEKGKAIEDARFFLDGYPQVLVSSEPEAIQTLVFGKKMQFNISMDVPGYTRYGEHNLEILVKGHWQNSANSSGISAKQPLLFVVHSATENETISTLDSATKLIVSMNASNIKTAKIESLLEDAKSSMNEWDYDTAKEIAERIVALGNSALKSLDSLQKIRALLEDAQKYGVDAPQTTKMYALAKSALERGDYERAEERANNAALTASIEVTGKVMVLRVLHEHSWAILGGILLSAFLASIFYKKIWEMVIKNRLRRLDLEEHSLKKLVSDAKKAYFERHELTKSEYYHSMADYEKRTVEIKRIKNGLALRMIKITKPNRATQSFAREEGRVKKLMEDAQRKYFERGELTRTNYKDNMKELKSELAEIKMMVESAGDAMKKGKGGLLAIILLCALIFLPEAVAQTPATGTEATASEAIKEAEGHITEMQEVGFGVSYANDTLNEAKLLLSKNNYIGAESLARYVGVIKKTAEKISGLTDEAETKLYDASAEGLDVSGAQKSFEEGVKAFEAEDYVIAERLLSQAINEVEEARAQASMQEAIKKSEGFDIADFLKKHWLGTLFFLSIAGAGGFIFWKKNEAARAKKKMKELEDKIKLANKMIAEMQRKYYEKGGMTKSEYNAAIKRYREAAIKAKRELAVLKSRIEKEKSAAHKLLLKSS